MPINRLLKDSKLEPEKVERLNQAYSYALRKLRLVDRDDPMWTSSPRRSLKLEPPLALAMPNKSPMLQSGS
jgi:hypothetical protein